MSSRIATKVSSNAEIGTIFHMATSSVEGVENRTKHYLEKLSIAFSALEGKTIMKLAEYTNFVTELPADLACKLRMVPDSKLPSRLSHLFQIYKDLITNSTIAQTANYSVVSVEGSNTLIPFDCDLVIYCEDSKKVKFIDYTSSNNTDIIRNKLSIIKSNIFNNKLENSDAFIQPVEQINIAIDIDTTFISSEPGTRGLILMDWLSKLNTKEHQKVLSKFREIYISTNLAISEMENTDAPGDYKEALIPSEIVDKSILAVQRQNDFLSLDLLKDGSIHDDKLFPYFNSLTKIAMKAHKLKKLIPIEAAKINTSRDVQSALASMEDYWLCKGLHAATLTESVVAVTDNDELEFLSDFPCSKRDETIPDALKYKACMKHKGSHVFTIKFNSLYIDEKLKRVLCNINNKKEKNYSKINNVDESTAAENYLKSSVKDYVDDYNHFTSISLEQPKDTIWRKIQTITALASNDLENMGRSTCSMLESYLSFMERMHLGSCLSHFYEVNKSILASLKVSPSTADYYVGVNGSYDSITLVKMSSTLDSFSKTNYTVIFKPERMNETRTTRLDTSNYNDISVTKFYSIDPNQLSYNLRLPMVISSLATWEIENNLESGAIRVGAAPKIIFDAAMHSLVNRDQFAQASEQIRYFYMSAIGYGGSAADITEKVEFITIRHSWEFLYLLRSFKVAASLASISTAKRLSEIEDKSTKELSVCFPHSCFPSKSFSQSVSSMYVCNVYNKFRAFHEVSDAICFNGIMDELDIYKSRVSEDEHSVSGLSPKLFELSKSPDFRILDYIMSESFIDDEVAFNLTLATVRNKRYSGSMSYIIGATEFHVDVNTGVIDNIYSKLAQAPIEACTMKGSMDSGQAKKDSQGIRAASAVLEELIRSFDVDPKSVNKSVLGAAHLFDKMAQNEKTFSIFNCVLLQFCYLIEAYRYRIVDKDQKGHREISVLNFNFRIGALFIETISRELSGAVSDVEVVHNPNKDKIVEDAISKSFDEDMEKGGVFCYDNSDQKRWGPNHNMNFFSFMLFVLLKKEPGLFRLCNKVLDSIFDKRAKFPEPLINLILNKGIRKSNSEPIQKFIDKTANKMDNKIFEIVASMGMCQGILHDTSSVYHAIKAKAAMNLTRMISPDLRLQYFTTSDDAEGIIFIPFGVDRISKVKLVHVIGLKVGSLFNIMRSNPKSAFNFHIAELNSIFYKKGAMATPALKQRISKIDVGFGISHIEDFLSALSSAANYLANGGSYMGAYIMSILNLVLHTEQWLRWDYANSNDYYKPVEMGGFPVIEPISTIISGGVSNFYLRSTHILSPENYSRLITNTLLCEPERLSLADFTRAASKTTMKSFASDDVTIYKGTGPFGLFQTIRTDRKLSVFERRHGISNWIIPESFANLNRSSSNAKDFLFTIFRNTSVNTLETNLGVNSFFIRMAEPWVSYNRNCYKVSKNSPFAPTFGGADARISHMSMNQVFKNNDIVSASCELTIAFRRCIRHPEFEVLETQLAVRLSDAKSLYDYLRSQEAETFKRSFIKPSIQTITLRGQSASDSDAYFLSILKSLSGKNSKSLINKYRRSAKAFDSIDIDVTKTPINLLDAIVSADNAVSIYNKFIRRDTKMIIPNKVEDMRELCIDILRNKFTERMGVKTSGRLELNPDRTKPYAYTKWYQELLSLSAIREKALAESALSNNSNTIPLIGIKSARGIITNRDMFEISDFRSPEKTVLIKSKSKTTFVNSLKSWLAAKVVFNLDRDTCYNLIRGRLTYAHDYFVTDSKFIRHAKDQYFDCYSRGTKGTHLIEVTIVKAMNKTTTRYKHILLFPEAVDRSKITLDLKEQYKDEKWLSELKHEVESVSSIKEDHVVEIRKTSTPYANQRFNRITLREEDVFVATSIGPSTEFRLKTHTDSISLLLETNSFYLPFGYAMPEEINSMKTPIRLTDEMFKDAAKVYTVLESATQKFSNKSISAPQKIRDYIDFCMVESTIHTEQWRIDKVSDAASIKRLNPFSLDIVRTMLINNKEIGVNYSSHRFSSTLLNMGKRRKGNFTHFTRKISGTRADFDSEDLWDDSDTEEMIPLGKSEAKIVSNTSEEDDIIHASYIDSLTNITVTRSIDTNTILSDKSVKFNLPVATTTDWAEMVEDEIRETIVTEALITQSRTEEGLFSEPESEDEEDVLYRGATPTLQNDTIPEVTIPDELPESSHISAAAMLNSIFGSLESDINYDSVFNFDDEENENGINSATIDEMDKLFSINIDETYGKFVDIKDNGLKSEISGHTVNQTLETARPIMTYLRNWLATAGKLPEDSYLDDAASNVTKLSSIYLILNKHKVLDMSNPMQQVFGASFIDIPVELSSLAVISHSYL